MDTLKQNAQKIAEKGNHKIGSWTQHTDGQLDAACLFCGENIHIAPDTQSIGGNLTNTVCPDAPDYTKQEHLDKHVKIVPDCPFCAQDKAANMAALDSVSSPMTEFDKWCEVPTSETDQPEPLALADNAINAQTEEIAALSTALETAQTQIVEKDMLIFRLKEAEKHNGWPNYETWCVNLWLTNEQGSYNWLHEIISENRQSVYDAAMEIREFVEGQNPLADQANMYTDMLAAALREVDWLRIIEANTDEEETE